VHLNAISGHNRNFRQRRDESNHEGTSNRVTAVAEIEILMSQYQRGDPAATTLLICQVSPLLLRFFTSQYGSRPEAEDLLQDTWLQIHKARHTYRPGEPVLPWIYAIARHVKVDGYRRAQRIRSREQPMSPLPEPRVFEGRGPAQTFDFDALVAVLPPGQREVVCMLKVRSNTSVRNRPCTRSSSLPTRVTSILP
jgi:RNA polymerase sigma-70 factor (ECF subfamily)